MTGIPMNSDNPTSLQIRTEILNSVAVNRKKRKIFLWNEQQALKNINYGENFILIKTKKIRLSVLFLSSLSACSTFRFVGFIVLNGKEYNNEKFIYKNSISFHIHFMATYFILYLIFISNCFQLGFFIKHLRTSQPHIYCVNSYTQLVYESACDTF